MLSLLMKASQRLPSNFIGFSSVNFCVKFYKSKPVMPPKRKVGREAPKPVETQGDGVSPSKVKKFEKQEVKEDLPAKEEKPKRAPKKQLFVAKTKAETTESEVKEGRPKRGTQKEGEKSAETKDDKSQTEMKKETKVEKPKRKTKKELVAEEKPKRGARKDTQPEEAADSEHTNGDTNVTRRGANARLKPVDIEPPKKGSKSKEEAIDELDSKTAKKKMPAKAKETKAKSEEKTISKSKKGDLKNEATASKSKSVKGANGDAKEPTTKLLNDSVTKWESIDFSCKKKNAKGEAYNFKITSWNVAGVRAWLKKDGMNIFKYDSPDILCLQELQCSEDKLPRELKDVEGYKGYRVASEKEGYAGVAVYSKIMPIDVQYGIKDEHFDNEGRCITLEYEKFYLVNVYVPNAGRGLTTLDKRLDWNEVFKKYIKALDKKKPVILCGDMNVAHEEIDLTNPKNNKKNAGFTPEEREGMTEFLKDGYVDTFRELYPDKTGAYTFWSYMGKARSKNVGWRLDYFIVSTQISDSVCDSVMRDQVLGSDHCPLSLFLHI